MPADYRKKQKEILRQIKEQYKGEPLEGPLRVEFQLQGEGRGDADNMVGAFFDTANKVLWVDDRISIIPEVEITWKKASKEMSCWIVTIYDIGDNQKDLF